jgi:hypothetical protein
MIDTAPRHNDSLDLYIEAGVIPGSFLTAVLENDLMRAFNYADSMNIAMMQEWASWLYMYGDYRCFGSKEIVENWAAQGGMRALEQCDYCQGTGNVNWDGDREIDPFVRCKHCDN